MTGKILILGVLAVAVVQARVPVVALPNSGVKSQIGQDPQTPRFNELVGRSPQACQDGTASLELVKEWLAQEVSYLQGAPVWLLKDQDLDLDGIPDLLIADSRLSGSGGQAYWAFLRTARGLRYIGSFLGIIRGLPSKPSRAIVATSSGSGRADVHLAQVRPDGLTWLASATVAAGDSGTDDGNRLYRALMDAAEVSDQTLRSVFGQDGKQTG